MTGLPGWQLLGRSGVVLQTAGPLDGLEVIRGESLPRAALRQRGPVARGPVRNRELLAGAARLETGMDRCGQASDAVRAGCSPAPILAIAGSGRAGCCSRRASRPACRSSIPRWNAASGPGRRFGPV
jgi:hypothetical protein